MNIYPCGAVVDAKIGGLSGMITCCSIRFEKANYEITYILNGEPKTIWMFEEEFYISAEKKQIGFK